MGREGRERVGRDGKGVSGREKAEGRDRVGKGGALDLDVGAPEFLVTPLCDGISWPADVHGDPALIDD